MNHKISARCNSLIPTNLRGGGGVKAPLKRDGVLGCIYERLSAIFYTATQSLKSYSFTTNSIFYSTENNFITSYKNIRTGYNETNNRYKLNLISYVKSETFSAGKCGILQLGGQFPRKNSGHGGSGLRKLKIMFNIEKMKEIVLVLLIAIGFSSCATIFCGTKKDVTFNSNIPLDKPSRVTVDGRVYDNVNFPFIAKVKRGWDDSQVTVSTDGYVAAPLIIEKTFNYTTLWNIAVGGLIGFGIDAISGAMMKPDSSTYTFNFDATKQ